jgi:alkylhydroperoxidase/carboxymuconolactone decarboxylase family protein YurZ
MSLPGLQELQQISPAFAAVAQRLGESAWTTASRTPRETTACFLACDLLHGLFGLPLRLHITMAQRLGVTDGYIRQIMVLLAPAAGYPQVAEALASSNALLPDPADDQPSDREIAFLDATVRAATGSTPDPTGLPLPVQDIVDEYGYPARSDRH